MEFPDKNSRVELFVIDIGGNDVFNEFVPSYVKSGTSYALLFDSTDLKSFESLSKWMAYIKNAQNLQSCKGSHINN